MNLDIIRIVTAVGQRMESEFPTRNRPQDQRISQCYTLPMSS